MCGGLGPFWFMEIVLCTVIRTLCEFEDMNLKFISLPNEVAVRFDKFNHVAGAHGVVAGGAYGA